MLILTRKKLKKRKLVEDVNPNKSKKRDKKSIKDLDEENEIVKEETKISVDVNPNKINSKKRKPVEDVSPDQPKKRAKLDKKQDLCYLQANLDNIMRPVSDPKKWCEAVYKQEDLFECSTRGVLKIIFATNLNTTTFIKVEKKKDVTFMVTKELMEKYFLSEEENEMFQMMYSSKN